MDDLGTVGTVDMERRHREEMEKLRQEYEEKEEKRREEERLRKLEESVAQTKDFLLEPVSYTHLTLPTILRV